MKTPLKIPAFAGYESGHETPESKRKFAEKFIRFVEGDFQRTAFNGPFYTRLSNTFGHIAHYNIHGFYDAQFSSLEARISFIEQCLKWPSYGSERYTYCDVERFLQDWVKRTGIIHRLYAERRDKLHASERAQLARLKAKHEGSTSGIEALSSLFK